MGELKPSGAPAPPGQPATRWAARWRSGETAAPLAYGIAALASIAAGLLRIPLLPLLGSQNPFTLFYPAVMLAGWIGGLGPGLVATSVSLLLAWFFFIPPFFSFSLSLPRADGIQLLLFGAVCVLITVMNEARLRAQTRTARAMRSARERQESLRRAFEVAAENEQERERLLSAAEAARGLAEAASRTKDEFLATVSHELRTPLNAVLSWAQLLQLAPEDAQRRRRGLEVIVRNAKLQSQLINDLLDVSRIVLGRMSLEVQPLDLAQVVEAVLAAVRPAAAAKQISIERLLDAGAVAGDPDRLHQVVWHLLSNAIKYTPPGGRIAVRLAGTASHLELVVTDDGAGLSPEFLPHIFDRFRQFEPSISRPQGGLGLGLSIVRDLVELHGGSVVARSPGLGQGSSFTVKLPLWPSPLATIGGSGGSGGSSGGAGSAGNSAFLPVNAPGRPLPPG